MRNAKEFINRVVKKMEYNPNQFTVVEYDENEVIENVELLVYEELQLGNMVFLVNSCVPSISKEVAHGYSNSDIAKVITADIDNGVSIIVKGKSETDEGINIQPLGVINSFLNELIKINHQKSVNEFVEETEKVESEQISLKDYYRLNLPNNKIGRKSDETLIKELKEAGFSV
jgi:hypothetical protein